MAMSSSSSSSRLFLKKYDVFISFRGEDTRDSFTGDLYSALTKEKILTYIDYKLKRGDDIWPALVRAIKDSVMAIVVFSERYATSRWCLQELVQIMECRRDEGQVVIPLFYRTNPTDVRHQKGSYKKPFEDYYRAAAHGGRDGRDKVDGWRHALTEAANISGWESTNQWEDSEVIEKIVKHVLQELRSMHYDYKESLVGIEDQCGAIEGFWGKLGRIGFWGMGGTGKTTIARALFAKHSHQYDSACFLKDVREESQIHRLTHIRDELLSQLLKQQDGKVNRRLSSRKVLIVLDDVDSSEQLEALCVGLGELGEGSSVIVTTRDKHLLHGIVDVIHEFKPWDLKKSLMLFSLAAFKKIKPDSAYEDLSQMAVKYAEGLPFILKLLGSQFDPNKFKFWESELRGLCSKKKSSFKEIKEMLKVSYHGLSRQEQAIFLDIAFFFKDKDEDHAIRILNACGFNAASGIEKLKDKALINISKSNTIQMLDLLQDIAFDIVQNDETDPSRGSRLSGNDLAVERFLFDWGISEVEGIVLDFSRSQRPIESYIDIFSMPKLRYLRIYSIEDVFPKCSEIDHSIVEEYDNDTPDWFEIDHSIVEEYDNDTPEHFEIDYPMVEEYDTPEQFHEGGSAELRYFEWIKSPYLFLPPSFCAKFLVEIRMPYSRIEHLWEGRQELVNLETIDLSGCSNLKMLPDLSKASKLKWVYLSRCVNLRFIHLSSVDTLVTLMLNGCRNLISLKIEKHLSHLQEFNFIDCYSLKEFSVSSDSIERLNLCVRKLYPSIGRLSKLVSLNLYGSRLQNLPDELSCLTSLEELMIFNCRVVNKEKLHVLCPGLLSLKLLHLKDCKDLFELPDNISALSSLQELRLDGSSVEKLPTSIKLLENLEILSLENCTKLESLPELPLSITELNAAYCISLVTVSSLKNFAVQMKGKEKHITYMNGTKLNECSLVQIMEDTLFTMKSAQLHNVLGRRFVPSVSGSTSTSHSDNYNYVRLCLPGSSVPSISDSGSGSGSISYRSTGSSITIEPHHASLSHWLGTIYFAVLSLTDGISLPRRRGLDVSLECRIYRKDSRLREYSLTQYHKSTFETGKFNSDHVFVWHGPSFIDAEDFHFTFSVRGPWNHDDITLKECGIHLMCCSNSELESFLGEAELEPKFKSELGVKLQSELDLRENYHDREKRVIKPWNKNKKPWEQIENHDVVNVESTPTIKDGKQWKPPPMPQRSRLLTNQLPPKSGVDEPPLANIGPSIVDDDGHEDEKDADGGDGKVGISSSKRTHVLNSEDDD